MKISELPNAPQWLLDAKTENADVEWVHGRIVWRGGDWQGGVWQDGVWWGGGWWGGVWQGGVWWGGGWWGGVWQGGVWQGGVWWGGAWWGGVWQGGDWWGGDWQGGVVKGAKVQWLHTIGHCEEYPKTLCCVDGVAWILAGCRWFTLASAKEYWAERKDRPLTRALTLAASEIAKQKGWKEE